jgi:hypothetical protein
MPRDLVEAIRNAKMDPKYDHLNSMIAGTGDEQS